MTEEILTDSHAGNVADAAVARSHTVPSRGTPDNGWGREKAVRHVCGRNHSPFQPDHQNCK